MSTWATFCSDNSDSQLQNTVSVSEEAELFSIRTKYKRIVSEYSNNYSIFSEFLEELYAVHLKFNDDLEIMQMMYEVLKLLTIACENKSDIDPKYAYYVGLKALSYLPEPDSVVLPSKGSSELDINFVYIVARLAFHAGDYFACMNLLSIPLFKIHQDLDYYDLMSCDTMDTLVIPAKKLFKKALEASRRIPSELVSQSNTSDSVVQSEDSESSLFETQGGVDNSVCIGTGCSINVPRGGDLYWNEAPFTLFSCSSIFTDSSGTGTVDSVDMKLLLSWTTLFLDEVLLLFNIPNDHVGVPTGDASTTSSGNIIYTFDNIRISIVQKCASEFELAVSTETDEISVTGSANVVDLSEPLEESSGMDAAVPRVNVEPTVEATLIPASNAAVTRRSSRKVAGTTASSTLSQDGAQLLPSVPSSASATSTDSGVPAGENGEAETTQRKHMLSSISSKLSVSTLLFCVVSVTCFYA